MSGSIFLSAGLFQRTAIQYSHISGMRPGFLLQYNVHICPGVRVFEQKSVRLCGAESLEIFFFFILTLLMSIYTDFGRAQEKYPNSLVLDVGVSTRLGRIRCGRKKIRFQRFGSGNPDGFLL